MNATATVLKYKVEALNKQSGESDADAVKRIATEHAQAGWELVEACGDEVRMPVMIFSQAPASVPPLEYTAEEISTAQGAEEIASVRDKLWQMHDDGWMPVSVLDSPVSNPIAVFARSRRPLEGVQIKVNEVALGIFEKTTQTIVEELLDQQVRDNLTLQCIMHGGLNPVLILVSKETAMPIEYLVEHARGGIFSNQSKTLTELLTARSNEGWMVCGAFEDSFLWPCVVFRRAIPAIPVTPRELVEESPSENQNRNTTGST